MASSVWYSEELKVVSFHKTKGFAKKIFKTRQEVFNFVILLMQKQKYKVM